jgi:hypothetical protein
MKPCFALLALSAMLAAKPWADPLTVVEPAELIYTDQQMGDIIMDASLATFAADPSTLITFHSGWWPPLNSNAITKYSGTLNAPFQTLLTQKTQMQAFPNDPNLQTNTIGVWMPNIYKAADGGYLGFVHLEDFTDEVAVPVAQRCSSYPYCGHQKYIIALAYSTNSGDTWKLCGNIIKANAQPATNIGGIPFLVKGGYFYVYFNEQVVVSGKLEQRVSVARAPVSNVLSAARTFTVTQWKKYNSNNLTNEGFNEDGLIGAGSHIIPEYPGYLFTDAKHPYDVHSDAAYSRAVNRYYLLVNVASKANLLYSSADCVNWVTSALIDNTPSVVFGGTTYEVHHAFPTIAALSSTTEDNREVGRQFHVLYTIKPSGSGAAYEYDTLYKKKVSVTADVMPSIHCLFP